MSRATHPPVRPLRLYATLWSLRQYPTPAREWSWDRKLSAIRATGCDGVFSPPRPELANRGDLAYLGVVSLDHPRMVARTLQAVKALGAEAVDVQLGDYDSTLAEMLKLTERLQAVATDLELPFAVETHRDTFTETPEATLALIRGHHRRTGRRLPLCLDHSHFAVVRHLAPEAFWPRLRQPAALLAAASQFHLRPFNGHHCQIPVLSQAGRFTPEYRDWRRYVAALFAHLHRTRSPAPVRVVPELGHAAPAYGLSCFGDTWRDAQAVVRDLRRLWRETAVVA